MFYYLNGTVAHIAQNLAVLDCGGVGYACKTTNQTLASLRKGEQAKLYTVLTVQESGIDLFGFSSEEEKNLFLLLTSVSGVGAKVALSILSTGAPSQLALAIITEDTKTLVAAPGVGKKLAQRIVLELKDKLAKSQTELVSASVSGSAGNSSVIPEDKLSEAAAALQVLGYSLGEVNSALRGLDTSSLTVEEVIRQALRRLAK